jgi:phosphotransferase system enzyme I (PtsI)
VASKKNNPVPEASDQSVNNEAASPLLVKGLAVSPGIVIGKVFTVSDDPRRIARRAISKFAVKGELARLDKAIKSSIDELNAVHQSAKSQMGDDAAKIFLVHVWMLSDKNLIAPMRKMVENELVTADYAVNQVLSQFADKFRQSKDTAFTTKVNDIDDLALRLIGQLAGRRANRLADVPEGTVVVASDLTPSQTAGFDRNKIAGFCTDLGGKTSHTAIVARALGIPAVVGCQTILEHARDGQTIILDGDQGQVLLSPTREQIAEYKAFITQRRTYQLTLSEVSDLESVTQDGTHIEVVGNIEFPDEAKKVLACGGEGVGLYRTEFLYLTGDHEPTEKDHFQAYKRCVELMQGKPLTIRTVDLGADKYTQAQQEVPERNPFLGCRSIRYCLRDQAMFKRQLRALLRASALGPVKIMFPLVTSTTELRHAKYMLNDVMEELAEDSIPFDAKIPVGMMVEVPSAAIMADVFAREVDFFSIGTNDLVQYTLAVDRTNERVANLYTPNHPAVIRLIKDTVRAARYRKIPVSCCGEAAADVEYALLLIGLGVRTLSVTSSSIPPLKRMIRSVSIQQCERIAKQAITFDSDVQVAAYLRDRARKILPEAFDGRTGE